MIKSEKINAQDDLSYFKTARSWADDLYSTTISSRNRYKCAFFSMAGLCALLSLSITTLVPLQHTELVIVHEGDSGYTWISTTADHSMPAANWARTQAEIAHYVRIRTAYDPLLYRYQTHEVREFNTPKVETEYELEQSSTQAQAPINILGAKGYRTVTINNILPLNNLSKNHQHPGRPIHLVQVNYVLTDHLLDENKTIKTPYSALVSWKYRGVPQNPSQMLINWDGFTITQFIAQPVNMGLKLAT